MADHSSLYNKIIHSISEPQLKRNLRGQLSAALRQMPVSVQKQLACEFVRHGIHQMLANEPLRLRSAETLIDTILSFMRGEVQVGEIKTLGSEIIHAKESFTTTFANGNDGLSLTEVGHLLLLVRNCCCQREMEAAGITFRVKYQPSASDLAIEVLQAVYSHHEKDRAVSDREVKWQIQQVLEAARKVDAS